MNISKSTFSKSFREARTEFERAYFEFQLLANNGNIRKMSETIGMERTHIYRKLKKLGINHTYQRLLESAVAIVRKDEDK